MRTLSGLSVLMLLTAVIPAATRAEELQQPVDLPLAGVVAEPPVPVGCEHLPPPAKVRSAQLIVRNSERSDVGPYTVTLPGYATNESKPDHYAPFVLEAAPGDTLRIDLINGMTDASQPDPNINLHTHGLIVSPRPEHPCGPAGDNIFSVIPPSNSVSYRIDIPRELPSSLFGRPNTSPAGLYWLHAHIHGSAKNQVTAGQAGILSIEPPRGSEQSATDPMAALRADGSDLKRRYLGLQDIQLAVAPDATPDKLGNGGKVIAEWISGDKYDPQACRTKSNPNTTPLTSDGAGEGFCGHTGLYDDPANSRQPVSGDPRSTVWLFTINGQRNPDITVAAGQSELWRVVNLSATVTYVLDLVDGDGTRQDLHLVTLDGVIAGTADPTAEGKSKMGVKLQRLLLMPASRAEILIQNTASSGSDRSFTLRTEGIETGGTNQAADSYNGDPWPAVKLAHVIMKGASRAGPLESLLNVELPSQRGQLMASEFASAAGRASNPAIPPNCVVLPEGAFRRRITFAQTDTDFRVGSEVVTADGHSIDDPVAADRPHTIEPQVFSHAVPPEAVRHVCPRFNTTEVWELVNTTNEMHNFHIHQSKFRLADGQDRGAPPALTVQTAWRDPGGVMTGQIPELQTVQPVNKVDVWHDTIPVPPRAADGSPGVVFVAIPFRARQQIGTFVYHCHILEHEDGGMMAIVQVFDPVQWSALRSPVRAASLQGGAEFCGTPPPGYTPITYQPGIVDSLTSLLSWSGLRH